MKWLIKPVVGLVGIITTAIVTAWLTGQPLVGLTKLRGLYETFIQSSVPAWKFALVFLIALLGIYYGLTHLPKHHPKGKVHFVPDAHNSGWSKQTDTEMNVRIGGTFTYEGSGDLVILKVHLKGTTPTTDMIAQVIAPDGTGRFVSVRELWLRSNIEVRGVIDLKLKPVLGTPGRPMKRELVFLDKFTRNFVTGPIEFPYNGPRA